MSELSKQEWEVFAGYFLPKYNSENSTNFRYKEKFPVVPNSDFDFFDENGRILSVQHTEANGTDDDVEMEIVRPHYCGRLIYKLKQELSQRGINNVHVSLNISGPPTKRDEVNTAAYWIAELIQRRVNRDVQSKIYSFDQQEFEIYEKECTRWVSQIDVFPDNGIHLSFGWSKYPLEVNGKLDSPERFINAVKRKLDKRYRNARNINLVVFFSGFAFDEQDIETFKKMLSEIEVNFQSIWVYQLWSGALGAFKVFQNE